MWIDPPPTKAPALRPSGPYPPTFSKIEFSKIGTNNFGKRTEFIGMYGIAYMSIVVIGYFKK
jgi:hypothetical protein